MSDAGETSCFLEFRHEFESAHDDVFVAGPDSSGESGPAFGGDILARSALASLRTCNGRPLHSLHARFLRPAPTQESVEFRVERLKQGRRLSHRRVAVAQGERLLADVTTCHVEPSEPSEMPEALKAHEFQQAQPVPEFPPPEDLPTEAERARDEGWENYEPDGMECRWESSPFFGASDASHWCMWASLRTPLSDSAEHHLSALAWLSDVHCDAAVNQRIEGGFPRGRFLSLDHVIWFHGPARWDDWLLVVTRSPICHQSRALTHREIYTRKGALLASITQEALLT